MSLSGKVVLITGASKGIGRATAERVAAEGASVVINYLSDKTAADELVAKIGVDRALAVQADVSKIPDIERLVEAAVDKFGKIDVVMPNGMSALFSCSSSTFFSLFYRFYLILSFLFFLFFYFSF